ncbi:MAG: hypothetical protein WA913_01440, partial [Pricia sp.]
MKRNLPWVLCVFASTFLFSQQSKKQELDSLENVLKNTVADTARVHLMCRLANDYGKIDSATTFSYAQRAMKLSNDLNYEKGRADAAISLGGAYMDYFELEEAEEHLKKGVEKIKSIVAKDSSKANLKLWLKGHYYLAINHGYQGAHEKEIELTQKVIPIAEKIRDSVFLANVYTNLGIKNINYGQLEDAYKSFAKSGKLNRKVGKPDKIIFDRLSFANVLYQMDSLAVMRNALDEAKRYLDENPDSIDWPLYHETMGLYYAGKNDRSKAIASLDKAKAILTEKKLYQELFILLQRYAFVYERMGDFEMAERSMTDFLDLALKNKIGLNTFQGYYKKSQYAAASGNFEDAYNDLYRALEIYDSLETLEKLEQVKNLELKYDTAEKEKEILALKNEKSEAALALEER